MAGNEVVEAAGVLLRRRDARGWRWLLLQARKHGEWGFPKGHLDPGETPRAAALRECAEESGIGALALDGPALEAVYVLRDGRRKLVHYFPAVTAVARVQLSHEHTRWRWVAATAALRLLPHDNLRALFRAHLAELG
jgi:8-oxo-dGTP pyrophosphatase MutT (NUDIX family)